MFSRQLVAKGYLVKTIVFMGEVEVLIDYSKGKLIDMGPNKHFLKQSSSSGSHHFEIKKKRKTKKRWRLQLKR